MKECEKKVLEFIKDEISKKGYPPTMREICDALNIKSTSTVKKYIDSLEQQGHLKRDAAKPRALLITEKNFSQKMAASKAAISKETAEYRKNIENLITILGGAVETRNMEKGAHVIQIKEYTKIIGEDFRKHYPEYGLTAEKVNIIAAVSPLHDIGKIKVPDAILLKPGKLNIEEWDIMKQHTIWGCEILKELKDVWDEDYYDDCYDICRYHHEKWDGTGYPDGLAGDDIPISAQIVALADVYDALSNESCYKESIPKGIACNMILDGQCGQFNPKLLESFKRCIKKADIKID